MDDLPRDPDGSIQWTTELIRLRNLVKAQETTVGAGNLVINGEEVSRILFWSLEGSVNSITFYISEAGEVVLAIIE